MDRRNSKKNQLTDSVAKSLGAAMKAQREKKCISVYTEAKDLGLTDTTIRNIEEGRKFPSLDKIVVIAQYLGWKTLTIDIAKHEEELK